MEEDYVPQSRDTSVDADRRMMALFREMPPEAKARKVAELSAAAQALSLAGLRHQSPGLSDRAARVRLAAVLWGREVVERAFGDEARLALG